MYTSHDDTLRSQAPAGRCGPASHGVIRVHAPGRLHLGFLDPAGSLGRRYGSLGLVIDGFETVLAVEPGGRGSTTKLDEVDSAAAPQEQARLQQHLAVLRRHSGWHQPLRVRLLRALPAHGGLGSGTQLALALGHAFARAAGLPWTTAQVAQWLGRGARSGVGIAGFDHGGFILDGGPPDADHAAPAVARFDFPAAWRAIVVLDLARHGLHGAAEAQALQSLPPFARERAADLCHRVLMQLLPALAEARFEPFAQGLSHIQRCIGDYFAPAQGGSMYASPAVARLMRWIERSGATAATGQSSWGPTAFAFMPSADAARQLVQQARAAGAVDASLELRIVAARNTGALVE